MDLKKYQPILEVSLLSFVVYFAHKLFFFINEDNLNFQNFQIPIEAVYGFFVSCSIVIIFILTMVKAKNIDNVGYTFLLLTFLKMGLSYSILRPILHSDYENARIEKINFFVIFILFLTIETAVTIRLLNKKQ